MLQNKMLILTPTQALVLTLTLTLFSFRISQFRILQEPLFRYARATEYPDCEVLHYNISHLAFVVFSIRLITDKPRQTVHNKYITAVHASHVKNNQLQASLTTPEIKR